MRRDRDQNLAFAGVENLLEGQMAFAFFGCEISRREKLAKPAIGGAVGWIGNGFEPINGDEPRSDQKLYFSISRLIKSAHHAGKRIAVGDTEGKAAEFVCGGHHFLRVRSAAQKRKISCYNEFG